MIYLKWKEHGCISLVLTNYAMLAQSGRYGSRTPEVSCSILSGDIFRWNIFAIPFESLSCQHCQLCVITKQLKNMKIAISALPKEILNWLGFYVRLLNLFTLQITEEYNFLKVSSTFTEDRCVSLKIVKMSLTYFKCYSQVGFLTCSLLAFL